MKGASVVLPTDVAGWRKLVDKALQVPRNTLQLPSQYKLRSFASGEPVKWSPFTDSAGTKVAEKITRNSAILVLLAPCETNVTGFDMCIPLTMRSSGLRTHKGQMALPGGRCDAGETIADAARREAEEEVGLRPDEYDIVGELRRVWSVPSKSWVTPVVAVAKAPVKPVIASPDEVESLHYLHLSHMVGDSAKTHLHVDKFFSQTWGGPVSMPCYFASDSQEAPIADPCPRSGELQPQRFVIDPKACPPAPGDPDAVLRCEIAQIEGTLVWGLTAFVLAEFFVRMFMVASGKPGTDLPCSKVHVLDPEADRATREKSMHDFAQALKTSKEPDSSSKL